jgi:hypothetical protein
VLDPLALAAFELLHHRMRDGKCSQSILANLGNGSPVAYSTIWMQPSATRS